MSQPGPETMSDLVLSVGLDSREAQQQLDNFVSTATGTALRQPVLMLFEDAHWG